MKLLYKYDYPARNTVLLHKITINGVSDDKIYFIVYGYSNKEYSVAVNKRGVSSCTCVFCSLHPDLPGRCYLSQSALLLLDFLILRPGRASSFVGEGGDLVKQRLLSWLEDYGWTED